MAVPTYLALMYHEIGVAGRDPCDTSPGYLRYVVAEPEFRSQLAILRDEGLRGRGLSELLDAEAHEPSIAITFDDGSETDLVTAAPLLRSAGFGATFFVVPAFLNRRGYLSAAGVRSLAEGGFEIGSHGLTHRFLTSLDAPELDRELADSKAILEQMTGTPVHHLSCPGGRWTRLVAKRALALGYRSVSTSRIGFNQAGRHRERIARLAVRRGEPADLFRQRVLGERLRTERMRAILLTAVRRALGDDVYDSLQRRFG